MLGHWHFYLLEDVIDNSAVPKELLFFEVVDEEGRVKLDILPSHEVGKAFGVKADKSVYLRPDLNCQTSTE